MKGVAFAVGAAALFGLGTPAAKLLLALSDPWMVAGLLYLGSGVGLGTFYLAGRGSRHDRGEAPLRAGDMPWATGAILAGGVIGPVLLMFGLSTGSASAASLLLNLEGVFTALLAWFAFREHVSARIALGMLAIVAGAFVLGSGDSGAVSLERTTVLIAGACLAWAVDNNLTRRVSGSDPVQLGALKGLVAGTLNVVVAHAHGAGIPNVSVVLGAAVLGLLSYGVSFILFVLALRHLGSGRTSAYFSTAPFIGGLGSVGLLGDPLSPALVLAGLLMAAGVWMHVTEHHDHEHVHEPFEHEHLHRHDVHHRHEHAPGMTVTEPHSHSHAHSAFRHAHPHFPDIHHRHSH
jgi:drug/metabolite transporter (DMT)-like permease